MKTPNSISLGGLLEKIDSLKTVCVCSDCATCGNIAAKLLIKGYVLGLSSDPFARQDGNPPVWEKQHIDVVVTFLISSFREVSTRQELDLVNLIMKMFTKSDQRLLLDRVTLGLSSALHIEPKTLREHKGHYNPESTFGWALWSDIYNLIETHRTESSHAKQAA